MNDLPEYYIRLFNAVTDAIAALDACNYGTAKQLLMEGQQVAEELYLRDDFEFSMNPLAK